MSESRREANKRKCRLRILKASRRLFREKGYDNTMMEDIAAKAELSKATIYNYFPNKESLLLGTMEDELEVSRSMLAQTDSGLNSYERIKRVLSFQIADSVPFIGVSRRILFLNASRESILYGRADNMGDMYTDIVKDGQREGVFREDVRTEDIVSLIVGFYINSQFNWPDIEDLSETERGERVSRMLDLTMAGCLT